VRRARLAGWILLAIALRFAFLGGDALWLDEGYTAWIAHLRPAERAEALSHDDAPPFYYALQHAIVPHLPPSETSVRIVSAVAGVAGVACLLAFPAASVATEAAGAFLAAGAYGVFYGRQARSYSLLILWEVLLIGSLFRFLRGDRRWLLGVIAAETLALWTHNVAVTLVVGANLAWLLLGRRDPLRWISSQAIALALWLPVLLRTLRQLSTHTNLNTWIGEFWSHIPVAIAPALSLEAMAGGARTWPELPAGLWTYRGPAAAGLSVVMLGTVALLLIVAFRRPTRRDATLAASLTLGPLLALTLLSAVTAPTYIAGRTDSVAYAGFVLWCAIGFAGLSTRGRWVAGAILGLVTALAISTSMPIGARARSNDRAIGAAARAASGAGDWICFVGLSRPSIDYYLSGGRPGRYDDARVRLHYPEVFGTNPAADRATPAESLAVWETEAHCLRDRFESRASGVFVYIGPMQPSAPRECTAEDLPYPGSLLAYAMNGLRPLKPIARARGDRVGVDWVVLRWTREGLIPRSDLKPAEVAP
jgi:hypothetical protein